MPNRLQYEDSPYLQQHKDNPVDWYPWGDEAFKKAKEEHKAIFISIGYSSCHWCHVMEHDVFENKEIAAFLNAHLVSIKVDREERPDIDKHYQEVHQLLNRRPGGWPTSIFATPQNKPFYAGTYIPPHTRDKMLGFSELIKIIAEKIAQKDADLFNNADEIERFLKPEDRPTQATKLNESVAAAFVKQAGDNFEPVYGGFSANTKFPHTSTLNTLLNIALIHNDAKARQMVEHTLAMMQYGGMYDLVEGGFCRYSVDAKWLVPHFEKMTYDNGLLCELYARAGTYLKNETYLQTAREIADFMLEKMYENGLFYSASDADTEGEEGKYFVYDFTEVKTALVAEGFSEKETAVILSELQITPTGNFEGSSIVRLEHKERPEWFKRVQMILKNMRNDRTYPFIDKKVQVSWNAMMIKALYLLAPYSKHYLDIAEHSLAALLESMVINDHLYHSALINKRPKVDAFLEDYAYLGTALIAAYEQTFNERYLSQAQKFANTALEKYYDNGRWFFSKGEFITEADTTDSSYPGAVGVIVDLLLSLGSLKEEHYRHYAFKTIEYYSLKMGKTPVYFPYFFNQVLRYIKEDRIIKSSSGNLMENALALAQINYPFTLKQADFSAENEFLVCGVNSCFAAAKETDALNGLILNSF